MRNERRIGGPVRVSSGDRGVAAVVDVRIERVTAARDRELDERGVDIVGPCRFGVEFVVGAGAADAAFDEELEVDAAAFVVAEAVVEGVAEGVEAEVSGAAGVGAVEEGAVVALIGHSDFRFKGVLGGQRRYRRGRGSDVKEKGPIMRSGEEGPLRFSDVV
jgi:hypothetical protein